MMQHFLIPLLTLKDNGGGAVAMAFARSLKATGAKVTILSSGFNGTVAVHRPENVGIDFLISPSGNRILALTMFFVYAVAYSFLRRPQLVYTHIVTGLIPNFSGRKPLMLAQDLEYRFYAMLGRRLAKSLFASVTQRSRLIVSSLWLEKFFRRRRLDILFSGDVGISRGLFDGQINPPTHTRTSDYLLIAKRGSHKRHDETCDLAARLAARGYDVTLIDQMRVAGPVGGPPTLHVLDAVSQTRMCELFRNAKVFICVSRAEGYGLTPLEALSQGCYVVTTPTPSTARMRNAMLTVVNGSDDLVERLVQAALLVREPRRDDSREGSNARCHVPFMEDWASTAVSAVEEADYHERH